MKIIQANKSSEVKKSEIIIRARYKLNPLAIKFITVLITGIKRSDDVNEEYVFKVKEFKELTGLKRKDLYKAIDEAIVDLLNNPIKIPLNDKKNSILRVNWISSAIYNAGEVKFKISDKLRPYLLDVQKKFVKYKLENILPLRSSYSVRLYEILKDRFELNNRYGTKAEKIMSVDELTKILEIPKSYQYSSGIKKRILEKSKEELKKHTDIVFNYEEIKTGRKVTHLKFFIRPNPNKQVNYSIMDKYFKSRRNFVALLRKNYSGNKKLFGYKIIDGENYWLGLDNKGLLYATSPKSGIKDFNAIESERGYDLWFRIAKESELYRQLVIQGMCLEELAKNNKELWNDLNEDVIRILNLETLDEIKKELEEKKNKETLEVKKELEEFERKYKNTHILGLLNGEKMEFVVGDVMLEDEKIKIYFHLRSKFSVSVRIFNNLQEAKEFIENGKKFLKLEKRSP